MMMIDRETIVVPSYKLAEQKNGHWKVFRRNGFGGSWELIYETDSERMAKIHVSQEIRNILDLRLTY